MDKLTGFVKYGAVSIAHRIRWMSSD